MKWEGTIGAPIVEPIALVLKGSRIAALKARG
jgi:hypothetical protein